MIKHQPKYNKMQYQVSRICDTKLAKFTSDKTLNNIGCKVPLPVTFLKTGAL
jgi:hypothetical protein